MQVKAGSLRAQVQWLRRENKLDTILARVPPKTAALMKEPPLASSWIDSKDIEPMLCAIESVDGHAGVLRMSRDSLRQDSFLQPLRPMLTGVLRLFHASPATLYRHMNDMVKTSVRGMDFAYHEEGATAGGMEVRYASDDEIPFCMFVSCMAALEMVLELCGVRGTVSEPVRLGPAQARFHISWS
jgi:hypothetical protein